MGVNFPAHLVIIKSTSQYESGCYKEYSDTQILQMMGRAGRPQFDETATVVIMTKSSLQAKYESLVNGEQLIESNLHKHMVEHLNAEIVLGAISDVSIAMEWLKATYLYQRVFKNPAHYGMNTDLSKDKIERKLLDICIKELNGLRKFELIYMDNDGFYLQPTKTGRLMAKFYITYETMKLFFSVTGSEHLAEMITLISSCKEFDDIHLRVNEKRCLNDLNKSKMYSVRFPLPGRIKTREMKINCLIQATFGCLTISEPSLNQDVARIFRSAGRIAKCLVEYLSLTNKGFIALHCAVILSKCFKARLWENSKYISRQLEKIGNALSTLLVNAGITTFETILQTNPREIELILKRNPPFGTMVIDCAQKIPKYSLQVKQNSLISSNSATICVTITLENAVDVQTEDNTYQNGCYLLIGDADNKIILFNKIKNSFLKKQPWIIKKDITRPEKSDEVNIYVIDDTFVGVDVQQSYLLIYDSAKDATEKSEVCSVLTNHILTFKKKTRDCNHKCLRKDTCCHECCKVGVSVSEPKKSQVTNFIEQIQTKSCYPSRKVKVGSGIFFQNKKMFLGNEDNNTSFNYDSEFQKNCQNEQNNPSHDHHPLNAHQSMNDINFATCYEEKQGSQDNYILDDLDDTGVKFFEETELQKIYFDVNFKNNMFKEKTVDECKSDFKKQVGSLENMQRLEIFSQKIGVTKHTHKIAKWDDEMAAEETFNKCLNFLTNMY